MVEMLKVHYSVPFDSELDWIFVKIIVNCYPCKKGKY